MLQLKNQSNKRALARGNNSISPTIAAAATAAVVVGRKLGR
jgi:hypothetical protein